MEAVDGNAIAGPLREHFGIEMTTALGVCEHGGTAAQIAELRVYASGAGSVARCPTCGAVVVVVTEIRGSTQVFMAAFELRDAPGAPPS